MISLDHATGFAVALFVIGLAGVLTRRNLIIIFVSVELMLNAVNFHLIAVSRLDDPAHAAGAATGAVTRAVSGEAVVLFVILLAACEVAIGLAILLGLHRHHALLEVEDIAELKE